MKKAQTLKNIRIIETADGKFAVVLVDDNQNVHQYAIFESEDAARTAAIFAANIFQMFFATLERDKFDWTYNSLRDALQDDKKCTELYRAFKKENNYKFVNYQKFPAESTV